MNDSLCTVDSAGAFIGGAARFLAELDLWISRNPGTAPAVIGRERHLTARWIMGRERVTPRNGRRIALNNVAYLTKGGPRVVLLRNALHFVRPDELASLSFVPPLRLRAQVPVVRRTAQLADEVVVPCEAMAERVLEVVPSIRDRLVVRHHPVTQRPWAGTSGTRGVLLVPIVNSPYKRLPWHLARILDAADDAGVEEIRVTAMPQEFPRDLASDSRLRFIGRLDSGQLDRHFAEAAAVYFPTQLESFGYPLAEARTSGRRVVALDTAQNREIAGSALAGFTIDDPESLRSALCDALRNRVPPDPKDFDPDNYFAKLFDA